MQFYREFSLRSLLHLFLLVSGVAFGGCENSEDVVRELKSQTQEGLSTIAGNPFIRGLVVFQDGEEIANTVTGESVEEIASAGSLSVRVDYENTAKIVEERFFIEGRLGPSSQSVVRKFAPIEFMPDLMRNFAYVRFGVQVLLNDSRIEELNSGSWIAVDSQYFMGTRNDEPLLTDSDYLLSGEQ